MHMLTAEAIDNIFELMNDKGFQQDIESIYADVSEYDEHAYIEGILPHKFILHDDCITVEMKVFMNVPYVNDRSNFIYEIDVDYNGEAL